MTTTEIALPGCGIVDFEEMHEPGTAAPLPSILVVGAGRVGLAFARACQRAALPVLGIYGRETNDVSSDTPSLDHRASSAGVLAYRQTDVSVFAMADVLVLAVREAQLPALLKELLAHKALRSRHVVLHTSGAQPASELLSPWKKHVAAVGTLHPLAAISDVRLGADHLRRAGFGIEGDEQAQDACVRIVRRLGGNTFAVAPESFALYHAAAVFASNYPLALANLARSMFETAGLGADDARFAAASLLESAALNLSERGLPGALTGPVARGDVATIERHLEALQRTTPSIVPLYKALGSATLDVVHSPTSARNTATVSAKSAENFSQIRRLFAPSSVKVTKLPKR